MAYMSAYNNINEFSNIVSNNIFSKLTKKQSACVTLFKRKQRFINNYDINQEVTELINTFFGEENNLEENGLTYSYNKLKEYVINNNLIGLILYASNVNDISTFKIVNTYIKEDNNLIILKVDEICKTLLYEYFNNDNEYIDKLCESTPGFEIYYKK